VTGAARLRCYCYLDRLQPRYAAFLGTVIQGDLPVAGMAAVFVEVAPGMEVFRLVDAAVKASRARPGTQVMEREFGLLELHAAAPAEVQAAGRAVLAALGASPGDQLPPAITSLQIIPRLSPYQAQLLNRLRRGTTLPAGTTLLVLECAPAALANLLANEAEKAANVDTIEVRGLGPYGRLWLAGTEAEALQAQTAIEATVAERKAHGRVT
jgi:hypothetical protein